MVLRSNRGARGFSLVEALVAVAIIGIVTAIAIPNLKRAITKARHRSAYSSIQLLESTIQAYMLDKDSPPTALNLTTLEPLIAQKYLTAQQRNSVLSTLDNDRLISYYGWTGDWMWGYDYNFTFRPKKDPGYIRCYAWPEGAWRYDTRDWSWEQLW